MGEQLDRRSWRRSCTLLRRDAVSHRGRGRGGGEVLGDAGWRCSEFRRHTRTTRLGTALRTLDATASRASERAARARARRAVWAPHGISTVKSSRQPSRSRSGMIPVMRSMWPRGSNRRRAGTDRGSRENTRQARGFRFRDLGPLALKGQSCGGGVSARSGQRGCHAGCARESAASARHGRA